MPDECKQVEPHENGLRDLVMLFANSELIRNERTQQLIKERFDLPFFPTVANTFQGLNPYTQKLLDAVDSPAKKKALREQLEKESEKIQYQAWTRRDSEHYAGWIRRNLPYVDRVRGAVKKNFYLGKLPKSPAEQLEMILEDTAVPFGMLRFCNFAQALFGWYVGHQQFAEAQDLVELVEALAHRYERCGMTFTECGLAAALNSTAIGLERRLAGVQQIDRRSVWLGLNDSD